MSVTGSWAARFAGERQVTLWHYVESQIEDRLVTKCGRQMHKRTTAGHLLTSTPQPAEACLRCKA